jgi:hypothetical protein
LLNGGHGGGSRKGRRRLLIKVFLIAASIILFPPACAFLVFVLLVKPLEKTGPQPVVAPYRSGSVKVHPASLVAGGPAVPVKITYTLGPEGIAEGGALRMCPGKILELAPDRWRLCLQWANGWGFLQRGRPGKPNHFAVACSRDDATLFLSMIDRAVTRTQRAWLKRKFLQKVGRRLEEFDPKDALIEAQKMTVVVASGSLREGDSVEFSLGGAAGLEVPYDSMETDYALEVDPGGTGMFRLEAAVPTLVATGGEPVRLEVVAPSAAAAGERIAVLVRCVDARGVLTTGFTGVLLLHSTGQVAVPPAVIVHGGSAGVAWFRAVVTGRGVVRIGARDESGALEGESNPIVCHDAAFRLLWGDLHTHSLVSDGTREPGYHYLRARHLLGRDFAAVADHDIWSLAEENARLPEEYALMFRTAEENYARGEFVTFPSFEWTDHRLGHRNVIFGPGERPAIFPSTDERYSTPAKLLAALAGRDVLVTPHHPAWKTHFGEMRFDFGPAGDRLQRLIEVYSTHGSSEYYGSPHPITHAALITGAKGRLIRAFLGKEYAGRRSGSYVRDALAAGHRFGLIAGSDDHTVGADPHKGIGIIYGGGLTGVFARSRTREDVWEALRARRVCATTGARIYMEMRTNGEPQGSELTADGPPHLTGLVVGASKIDYVQVVKFDGDGYSIPWEEGAGPDGSEVVVDFTDRLFKGDSFYYLRAVQSDGHIGWAGPTWVDRG